VIAVQPFRYLLRVRYGECDAQGIVYNARWADFVDIAACEFTRALFGSITAMDLKLVKLAIEWRASARFDDVLELRVTATRVGTTSFETTTEIRRLDTNAILATATTTYVAVDASGDKRAITSDERAKLVAGRPNVLVDHAGAKIGATE
jgi:acyl-CoA thioester hydrolase